VEAAERDFFADRAEAWVRETGPRALAAAVAALGDGVPLRTVVLVEGASDRAALEVLAARRGRDLSAEGVAVVALGGAKNAWRYVRLFGPPGHGVGLAGLCDRREEPDFRRALTRARLGPIGTREQLERRRFFVCEDDLEDELIRALGAAAVEEVIESQGDGRPWRTFRRQAAQARVPVDRQLRRFTGTRSGRKTSYAALFVAALDLDRIPRPLGALLDHV
jgi:hypothetical protein